jgi:hypothetical protein
MKETFKQAVRCAVLLAIGLTAVGCERIGSPANPPNAPETAAIPASLGDLVGVTQADSRSEAILWFKQPDQTIVAVRVNEANGTAYVLKTKYPRN